MRPDDIETVSAIENRAYVFPWTPGIFRDCLRAGHHCWVLEAGSTLLGYGVLSAAAGEAHILNICIAPEYQGRGHGRRLLRRLVDLARWHQANQVFLEATIAEVTLTDSLSYGLTWFFQSGEFNTTFSDAANGAVALSAATGIVVGQIDSVQRIDLYSPAGRIVSAAAAAAGTAHVMAPAVSVARR